MTLICAIKIKERVSLSSSNYKKGCLKFIKILFMHCFSYATAACLSLFNSNNKANDFKCVARFRFTNTVLKRGMSGLKGGREGGFPHIHVPWMLCIRRIKVLRAFGRTFHMKLAHSCTRPHYSLF